MSKYVTGIVLFASLSGCAGTQEEARRYFLPPPPDVPKIELLEVYSSQDSFPKTGMEAFTASLVGEEQKTFDKPWGIATDGKGKVYVADTGLRSVMVYDLNAKTVTPFGGSEMSDLFLSPIGVAVDGKGNVYISDSKKQRVFSFTKDEKPLNSIGTDETLAWPAGMAVDDKLSRLYVVNAHKHNLAVFDLSGKHLFSIGRRGNRDGEFNFPTDVDMTSTGNIVVADAMNARVQIFDPTGKFVGKFGQRGDGLTDFQMIKGIAVDKKTDNIYVVDGKADRILIFNKEGVPLLTFGGSVSAYKTKIAGGFMVPQDINIDADGYIYIVDSLNRRFQVMHIVDDEWLKKRPIEKGR